MSTHRIITSGPETRVAAAAQHSLTHMLSAFLLLSLSAAAAAAYTTPWTAPRSAVLRSSAADSRSSPLVHMMATPEQYARMSELLQQWDDEEDGPSNDCMQVSTKDRGCLPLASTPSLTHL